VLIAKALGEPEFVELRIAVCTNSVTITLQPGHGSTPYSLLPDRPPPVLCVREPKSLLDR
jgi:hypothetical protein